MTGIYPSSQSNQNALSKCKMSVFLLFYMFAFMESTAFALFEAQSSAEIATGISTSIEMSTVMVLFFLNMMKMKNIIELIGKFEDFIEMSKHLNHMKILQKLFLFKNFIRNRIAKFRFKDDVH